jgi:hypothetical protein
MFGHQDDKHNDDNGEQPQDAGLTPENGSDQAVDAPQNDQGAPEDQSAPAGDGQPADGGGEWQHPGDSGNDSPSEGGAEDEGSNDSDSGDSPEPIRDIIQPAGGSRGADLSIPTPAATDDDTDGANAGLPHDLVDIKQQALTKLAPLVDQLDQTPEEKFRTTMMMIQASDDQSLVKAAYEAANSIEDEKVRAQALLDVVNEINYFTQHPAD